MVSDITAESNQRWYAISVRPKYERIVSAGLAGKGYQEFLPLYPSSRRWSDRAKTLDAPLFPGYLFCRFEIHKRFLPVLTTPGVIAVVGVGRTPEPVPDAEINAIQTVMQSGLVARPWPGLPAGSLVSIERGPLAGIEGTVLSADTARPKKKDRLIVSVQLLQRSIAVEIQPDWIRALPGASSPLCNAGIPGQL